MNLTNGRKPSQVKKLDVGKQKWLFNNVNSLTSGRTVASADVSDPRGLVNSTDKQDSGDRKGKISSGYEH